MSEKKFTVKEIAPFMVELCDALAQFTMLHMPDNPTEEQLNSSVRAAKAAAELSLFLWGNTKMGDPRFQAMKTVLEDWVKAD